MLNEIKQEREKRGNFCCFMQNPHIAELLHLQKKKALSHLYIFNVFIYFLQPRVSIVLCVAMSTLLPLTKQVFQKTRPLVSQRLVSTTAETLKSKSKRLVFDSRSPSLQDFLAQRQVPLKPVEGSLARPDQVPYLQAQTQVLGKGKKFYIEVYGCQVPIFLCFRNPFIFIF